MFTNLREENDFRGQLEEYWRRRDKEWRRRINPPFIGIITGLMIAAIAFILEILGVLNEIGIILGILGILITLLSASWGAKAAAEETRREIRDGIGIVLSRTEQVMRGEGDRIVGEMRKEAEKVMDELKRK